MKMHVSFLHLNRDAEPSGDLQERVISPLRVLIVDDEEDNRLILEFFVQRSSKSAVIDTACNGEEYYNKFIASPYDLVLSDVRLPKCDGITASSQVRQWEREQQRIPSYISILTGDPSEELQTQANLIGCNKMIRKPYTPEEITKVIQDCEARRQQK